MEPNEKNNFVAGVFVHFESTAQTAGAALRAEEIASQLSSNLKRHHQYAPLAFAAMCAHLVRGKPWLEDLDFRFPASRLRIELKVWIDGWCMCV